MEEAIGVGAAQDSELGLGLGVVRVRSDDECLVEKDFSASRHVTLCFETFLVMLPESQSKPS